MTGEGAVKLAGSLYRVEGVDLGVIMAHSGVSGESRTGLDPLARQVAAQGATVLTFDFRGFGQTGGSPALDRVESDVLAAFQHLRDLGLGRIACLGVG